LAGVFCKVLKRVNGGERFLK